MKPLHPKRRCPRNLLRVFSNGANDSEMGLTVGSTGGSFLLLPQLIRSHISGAGRLFPLQKLTEFYN